MSESNTDINLFTNSGCLTTDALKGYISATLSDVEKNQAQNHLEDCELCSDALEGLQLLTDPDKLDSIVTEINENVQNRHVEIIQTKKLKSQKRLYYFAAAASILILIGVFSYFRFYWQTTNSEIATLTEKAPIEETVEINVTSDNLENEEIVEEKFNESKSTVVSSNKNEKKEIPIANNDDQLLDEMDRDIEIAMEKTDLTENQKGIAEQTIEKVIKAEPTFMADNEEPSLYIEGEDAVNSKGMVMDEVVSYEDQIVSEMQMSPQSPQLSKKSRQNSSMETSSNNIINPDSLSDSTLTYFSIVENFPEFPGGSEAMLKYLQENVSYPDSAKLLGIQGTIFVSFVVKKSGKVDNAKVIRGIGGGCDEVALKVVESMPSWIPGKQRGKPVSVKLALPIEFKLN